MIQILEGFLSRFSVWLAADPEHAQVWTTVGLAVTIAAIAMLTFEQLKARAAAEHN